MCQGSFQDLVISYTQTAGRHEEALSSHGYKHTPVVEVHDSLDGAASSSVDVPFKAWQQRRHHVHTVLFTLPTNIQTETRLII